MSLEASGPGRYQPRPVRGRLSPRGYLEYLDDRMGLDRGALYALCMAATRSKKRTVTKKGVKVTYRGESERMMRSTPHHTEKVSKAIFLIEFSVMKAGERLDRVIQVHLEK